jgi:predicted ATPase/Tfp pilus assembly protein PilF
MTIGRILANGKDKGSAFALASPGSSTTRVVLTAHHVVRGQDLRSLQFAPYRERVGIASMQSDAALDVAVLYLAEDLPGGLKVGEARVGESWQVEAQPRPNDPALTGTISFTQHLIENAQDNPIIVLQLKVDQEVDEYKGYSGSSVTLRSSGAVVGILVEQVRSRLPSVPGQATPAANVLYAVPMRSILDRFDLSPVWASPLPDSRPKLPGRSPPFPKPRLFGRDKDARRVRTQLLSPDARLVTLTGPGGVGKTCLAQCVAANLWDTFADGGCYVSFAELRDDIDVARTLARQLGAPRSTGQLAHERLIDYLRPCEMLLLLDNCDHVLRGVASLVGDLLVACPGAKVLATSREPLHGGRRRRLLQGIQEIEIAVAPLVLPDTRSDMPIIQQSPAVRLFVQQARRVKDRFKLDRPTALDVAEICRLLDGLPLAIELAAAQVKIMTPSEILAELGSKGPLKRLDARMEHTIAWSYRLLDHRGQALLRRLSVFPGGCTIEAAQAIWQQPAPLTGDVRDGLAALAEKSLLGQDVEQDGDTQWSRYKLLEPIRAYSYLRLQENGELEPLQRVHAEYFLSLAETAEPQLRGPEAKMWLKRLEAERDNLAAALRWYQESGAVEEGLRLAGALERFWDVRGYLGEGLQWLKELLAQDERAGCKTRLAVQAKALAAAGKLAESQADYKTAITYARASLDVYQSQQDEWGQAHALNTLGLAYGHTEGPAAAIDYFEKSLALRRQIEDRPGIARVLANLGNVAYEQGDRARAEARYDEGLAVAQEAQDTYTIAILLQNLGYLALEQHEEERARAYLTLALLESQRLEQQTAMATILRNLGTVALSQNDTAQAQAHFVESLTKSWEIGDKRQLAYELVALGTVALAQGKVERATRLLAAGASLQKRIGLRLSTSEQERFDGEAQTARTRLGETFDAVWTAGAALSLREAVEFGLGGIP